MNTLYDLPGVVLRAKKELLRIRKYGSTWTLTHKSGGKTGATAAAKELETGVADGKKMDLILRALGYAPTFRYEKSRGVDGRQGKRGGGRDADRNFCEIEGPPRWIDATAKNLGVSRTDYITKNYATLFAE